MEFNILSFSTAQLTFSVGSISVPPPATIERASVNTPFMVFWNLASIFRASIAKNTFSAAQSFRDSF